MSTPSDATAGRPTTVAGGAPGPPAAVAGRPEVLLTAEQLLRPVPGGIGTYVRGLLTGLAARGGPLVTLLTARGGPRVGEGWPARVSHLPVGALTRAWDLGVRRAPRGYDLVHATSLAFPLPGSRRPLSVTVHDLAWRALPGAFSARGRRWHEQALLRVLRCADRFVVPSRLTADALLAAGVPAGRVEVIAHGSDHLAPPDEHATARLLDELGVRGRFVLTVGTREPRKNLARVVEAHADVRRETGEKIPLVVVGPAGWDGEGDNGRVPVHRPWGEDVVDAGVVADSVLTGLYARAECLVYAPLLEGFGFPALEAMAAGTPVVASPLPSTGAAARHVDPHDVDGIARALRAVLSGKALRDELAAAGLAHAKAHRWVDSASAHAELWESLLGRAP